MKSISRIGLLLLIIALAFALGERSEAQGFSVVTNTNDSGQGSLRQALYDANADLSSADTIVFNIPTSDPGFDGSTFTIQPLSQLPLVRQNTVVDGGTQTAFTGDTNPHGPEVVLNGHLQPAGTSGLLISGDGNRIESLVLNGFPDLGTGFVRNIDPTSSDNAVVDCYVGTDATGTVAVPNDNGILIGGFGSPFAQARNNRVEGNVFSGNHRFGLVTCDAADNLIRNNRIGTDRTGTLPLGNGQYGIFFACAGSPRNLIEGNVIAWNVWDGIYDQPDYRFGVAFTADGHQGNTFRGNSIHSNGGLGIDLAPPPFPPTDPPSTPNPNDSCDGDNGANRLQNHPEITRAETTGGVTTVEGFLDSAPGQTYTVELFANGVHDASGFGEGETPLGPVGVSTDGSCYGAFSVVLASPVAPGHWITATATDGDGNTSEFSPAFEVETIADTTPPVIASVIANPGVLWPPNHQLHEVTVSVDATDEHDGAPAACHVAAVTSDEPVDGTGDGDTTPDWVITGPLTVELRAERAGAGDGRHYDVELACADAAGNVASAHVVIEVPHSRGGRE